MEQAQAADIFNYYFTNITKSLTAVPNCLHVTD